MLATAAKDPSPYYLTHSWGRRNELIYFPKYLRVSECNVPEWDLPFLIRYRHIIHGIQFSTSQKKFLLRHLPFLVHAICITTSSNWKKRSLFIKCLQAKNYVNIYDVSQTKYFSETPCLHLSTLRSVNVKLKFMHFMRRIFHYVHSLLLCHYLRICFKYWWPIEIS